MVEGGCKRRGGREELGGWTGVCCSAGWGRGGVCCVVGPSLFPFTFSPFSLRSSQGLVFCLILGVLELGGSLRAIH